ncbi:MAG TPA: sodium:solute symporter family protein [Kofleriaceae bacterium]|nr:sodium:solute symporter family protein [Kofleriaceae bacterium]
MSLAAIDVVIIAVYLAIVVAIGLWFARRASGGLTDYFNAGRRMPWYLIGTSMAATTLAADTPLAVTELVRQGGLAGAWYGWSAAIGTVTAAVFFSRLWRRSGVLTDAELVELRYAGRPAAALRATRAAYLALPVNCLILGWVIFAMVSIVETVAGVRGDVVLPVILLLAIGYSTASGMWGVVATDAFQMVVAVVGLVLLAGFSVAAAGGLDALAALPAETTALVPSSSSALLPLEVFAVYLGMQWWATRNADGGEYIGLKLFSARSVADAQLGMVWYAAIEYVVKMWPLIVAALASIVLYPQLASDHEAYPRLIADHLPVGLRGLLVAALLAAFMSTVDTHLSWGASYLVNDLYKRFVRPDASERHYVRASRIAMVLIGVSAALVSRALTSVADTWKLLLALGSGQGLVVLLRWYWWRINAWSEISAMLASAVFTVIAFQVWPGQGDYAVRLIAIVVGSTAVWLAVTLLTPPEPMQVLRAFHDRVRPRGGFWRPVAGPPDRRGGGRDLLAWLAGVVFVYAATFAVGFLLLGPRSLGAALVGGAALAPTVMLRLLRAGEEEAGG